jgi:hypothetical protein
LAFDVCFYRCKLALKISSQKTCVDDLPPELEKYLAQEAKQQVVNKDNQQLVIRQLMVT